MTDSTPADDGQVDTTPVKVDTETVNPDGGITLAAAARILGCSERTARRWVKDGTLSAHKLATPQGGAWCVHLDTMPVKHAGMSTRHTDQPDTVSTRQPVKVDTPPAGPELIKALELVDRLQRDNQQLAGQLGYLQAKLQDAQEQIRLLTVDKDEPAAVDESQAQPRRSWWRRLFD